MREIPLTQGAVAIVDDDDYEFLMNWKWNFNGGYARTLDKVSKQRKILNMHRVLLDANEGEIVDHVNRNKLDNRRNNLRISDCVGNARNRSKYMIDALSDYKGVSYDKKRGKYHSYITVEKGKRVHLGHYTLEKDAAYYYNEYALKYFGEFAVLNHLGLGYNPTEPFSPGAHKNKTSSKYIGVSRRKSDGKYKAYIVTNSKQIHLGIFTTERVAAEMYNTAALEFHGEKAKLNIFDQVEGIIND
jgi:hypothetical protein